MAVDAVRTPRVDSRRPVPSPDVLGEGDGLQVVRVDALRYSADVVEDEALWYRLYEVLVGDPMGDTRRRLEAKEAVSAGRPARGP